jgi:sugar phosphate isomerase/epimerase
MRRRELLALFGAAATPSFGRTLKPVGVQLYTVRSILPQKPAETLKAIEEMGYREVEAVYGGLEKIWPDLKKTSMKPVSVHLDTALFTRDAAKLPAALDDVKSKGFSFAVCPYIAPQDRGGADVMRKLADTLNKGGEMCRKSGMHLCYHNHAFEFEPAREGGTLLDILMKAADPKLVSLELDIMWSHVAGVNPVNVLKQYGKRVALMHVKNVSDEVKTQYHEKVPRSAFREVGNGVVDVKSVLQAAQKAGVKHYFVEQDQTPGDPLASLKQSYDYLAKLNY